MFFIEKLKTFTKLSYDSLKDFLYGYAPNPVTTKNGLVIGGGLMYPEINFTLPPMEINQNTMDAIKKQYTEILEGVLKRARELHAPGIIVEVELLPPMTEHPKWGIEIHKTVRDIMYEHEAKYGLKSALRITPNDVRENIRPPFMRGGANWDAMMETFTGCAKDGADFLAIESTGGKEIHDGALMNADISQVIFALGIMGVRDMGNLWKHISDIAIKEGSIASGDTACGFGNTAMVLADRGFIPKVFAAVVRVATVSRSLVAYEMGAVGPSKDCAYEGPYMKAIAGVPIAMEGKSSSCAHLSPLGNIAAAVADLWSNESVQNIRLLGGMAPVVSMEQLIYDCRLMNQAMKSGKENALRMQQWLTDSDSKLDPQAYVLRPDIVYQISKEIVKEKDSFIRTKRSAQIAIDVLRQALAKDEVIIDPREYKWLDIMESQIAEIPDEEEAFWRKIKGSLDLTKFLPSEYGLS